MQLIQKQNDKKTVKSKVRSKENFRSSGQMRGDQKEHQQQIHLDGPTVTLKEKVLLLQFINCIVNSDSFMLYITCNYSLKYNIGSYVC